MWERYLGAGRYYGGVVGAVIVQDSVSLVVETAAAGGFYSGVLR